mmetsp:Transcript_124297/g.351881  ORF Transcript_124297/g.351881 Transcript_124297/m.351881 type:complete len:217 (-) Transcript_124297:232-882(-)
MDENPRQLVCQAAQPLVARVKYVESNFRRRERQCHAGMAACVVLQCLDEVPHNENNLCVDLTSFPQLVQDTQHRLGPVKVGLVQVERHDGVRAQAVAQHRECRGPSVPVGVAEEAPGALRIDQRVTNLCADLLPPLLRHRRLPPRPCSTGDEEEVPGGALVVVRDADRVRRDVHVGRPEPAREARRLPVGVAEEPKHRPEHSVDLARRVDAAEQPL